MKTPRAVATSVAVLSLVACAAVPKEAARAPEAPATQAQAPQEEAKGRPGYPAPSAESTQPLPGYPAQSQGAAAPPPSPAPAKPASPSVQPTSPGAGPVPSDKRQRGAAMAQAGSEIEAAQRELDLAGSECRSACRALASMDRATGHLCELAQSSEESRRCEDARRKLLGAREKVRTTCGSCPGGPSVDPGAPIPSSPR